MLLLTRVLLDSTVVHVTVDLATGSSVTWTMVTWTEIFVILQIFLISDRLLHLFFDNALIAGLVQPMIVIPGTSSSTVSPGSKLQASSVGVVGEREREVLQGLAESHGAAVAAA